MAELVETDSGLRMKYRKGDDVDYDRGEIAATAYELGKSIATVNRIRPYIMAIHKKDFENIEDLDKRHGEKLSKTGNYWDTTGNNRYALPIGLAALDEYVHNLKKRLGSQSLEYRAENLGKKEEFQRMRKSVDEIYKKITDIPFLEQTRHVSPREIDLEILEIDREKEKIHDGLKTVYTKLREVSQQMKGLYKADKEEKIKREADYQEKRREGEDRLLRGKNKLEKKLNEVWILIPLACLIVGAFGFGTQMSHTTGNYIMIPGFSHLSLIYFSIAILATGFVIYLITRPK